MCMKTGALRVGFTRMHTMILRWFFHDGGSYPIETSPLICRANQWTGFCMMGPSVMKEFKIFSRLLLHLRKPVLLLTLNLTSLLTSWTFRSWQKVTTPPCFFTKWTWKIYSKWKKIDKIDTWCKFTDIDMYTRVLSQNDKHVNKQNSAENY